MTQRDELIARYAYGLDGFQLEALDALDAGQSVLVAAPTGSGKTVVAEYAVAQAVRTGRRAFYTAPIKALSNQKFHDLAHIYGADEVGLITGDNVINPDAPVVVMTTEVLRNMIYARSSALANLDVVVLDEVHYLQDAYRGPVWEEVIIHLPASVRLVCLSATVSNASELAEWMSTVRGPTAVIVEHRRPVTLHNLYFIGDRTANRLHLFATLVDGQPNPEAARVDGEAIRGGRRTAVTGRRRLYAPSRLDVIERLDDERMLPAIYFIFSRRACDEAAASVLDSGAQLTTTAERERIRDIARRRLDGIDARDLTVLGHARFLAALEIGVAAHHAGMVPPFKEVVEACFAEGLIKVVFATETLAVGVNMPARSVVIDKLTKFTGEHHASLTPGEYTQLTGRAGRRGIDEVGHAIVLWNPFVSFDQVSTLASSRSFHLVSAFRPTYNMAANLIRTFNREQTNALLSRSFAQYQADRDVVRLAARLERRRDALTEARQAAHSPFGDIDEYRHSVTRADRRQSVADAIEPDSFNKAVGALRPGDIVIIDRGRHAGRVAVLSSATRRTIGAKVRVITPHRVQVLLTEDDFSTVPRVVGRVTIPTPFAPNRQAFQREVARSLERAKISGGSTRTRSEPLTAHPVTDDPDLRERLRSAGLADRIQREVDEVSARVDQKNGSLAAAFSKVFDLLASWRVVDGWSLTPAGQRLARLFNECDLLIVEVLERGVLDGLDPPTLAALVSVFTYEHRSPDTPPAPWFPSTDARKRWRSIEAIAQELGRAEDRVGLNPTRQPDPTFGAVAYAWAAGEGFAEVVDADEVSGGDFVRNVKQLVDLLRQLAEIAPLESTRRCASKAADLLFRGVVSASSTVRSVDAEPE